MTDLEALLDRALAEGELLAGVDRGRVAAWYPEAEVSPEITAPPAGRPPRWGEAEAEFVARNFGYCSDAELGAVLGRSEMAVKLYRQRHLDLPGYTKHPELMTARAVGEALGIDSKSVATLQDRGILPDWWQMGARSVRMMRRVTVYRWAITPRHWPYFIHSVRDTSRMGEEHLRRLVVRQQERWPDEWLSSREAAAIRGVSHTDINRYIHLGKIEAAACVKHHNWWILRSEIEREDLVFYRGKGETELGDWSAAGDAFLLAARAAGRTWVEIERLMKWPRGRAAYRHGVLIERAGAEARED